MCCWHSPLPGSPVSAALELTGHQLIACEGVSLDPDNSRRRIRSFKPVRHNSGIAINPNAVQLYDTAAFRACKTNLFLPSQVLNACCGSCPTRLPVNTTLRDVMRKPFQTHPGTKCPLRRFPERKAAGLG